MPQPNERYPTSNIPPGRRRVAADVDERLVGELEAAIKWVRRHTPYSPTKVSIITRGLELALDELRRSHDVDSWDD